MHICQIGYLFLTDAGNSFGGNGNGNGSSGGSGKAGSLWAEEAYI